MKYRISISAEVASEILSTSSFYEGVKEGLGLEFEKDLDEILGSISNNPLIYPKEFGPVHRAFIKRFKQVLFYVVRGDTAVVIDIRDARREPPDWKSRGFNN